MLIKSQLADSVRHLQTDRIPVSAASKLAGGCRGRLWPARHPGRIECKLGDASVSPGLRYLTARFPGVIAWQVSAHGTRDFVADGVRVAPAVRLLRELV